MATWVKAIDWPALQQQGRAIFRHQGKQIVLFATEHGLFACNNRCPHEGYPLREGSLDDRCVLTCNWHNWKFDLTTGANLYGGDRMRVYPTERRDDQVWIDVSDAPLAERRNNVLDNLRAAFLDHDYTRIARELGRFRLLSADTDPLDALREAIIWTHDRLEFGWTHAYAGSADWLRLYDDHADDPEAQLICLLESIGHMADDTLREPVYPYPQDSQPFNEDAFVAAIDNEDETAAVALLRGALQQGLGFAELERGLCRAALAHYADFGHSLIYVVKAGQLIQRLGESVQTPLLLALTRSLVFAFREELIPEFRGYAKALADWQRDADGTAPEPHGYRGLAVDNALRYTVAASAAAPESIYRALLGANADNLLRYDITYQYRYDRPVSDNVGWLSFSHGITFANAVRETCGKYPELWPAGLLQLACFAGRNQPYTDATLDVTKWAVDDRKTATFFHNAIDQLFDHGRDEYIVSVHLLKTLLAGQAELGALEQHDGQYADTKATLRAALNRFLHSPLKLKHTRRSARQALAFVAKDA